MGWGPVELVAILFTTLIISIRGPVEFVGDQLNWWQSGGVSPATCHLLFVWANLVTVTLYTTLIIGVWWQSGDVSPATCHLLFV